MCIRLGLIQPKWINAAHKQTLERNRRPVLRSDAARFGSDKTASYRRQGGWVRLHQAHCLADTMTTAGFFAKAITGISAERENQNRVQTYIDEVSAGGGALDRLLELGYDSSGLRARENANDGERFANVKAEWYWAVRDIFEAGEIDTNPSTTLWLLGWCR